MNNASEFNTPPPKTSIFLLSFPVPKVLLVTIDREQQRNSVPVVGHSEGLQIWHWFDDEPSLRVGIVTGKGTKAFCAGADLLEQRDPPSHFNFAAPVPEDGFLGLSLRRGKKPVIAAVNGMALGGGFEACLNCDLVISSPEAEYALPEVRIGAFAAGGGLAQIVRACGLQIGSELALTGRRMSAQEAKSLRLVNIIAKSPETVVDEAITLATQIVNVSPDSVVVSRFGLNEAMEVDAIERLTRRTTKQYGRALMRGENYRIGVEAYANKKKPKWVDSKL
ncbi:enoyl-CoA hydratase/isomerase family protein [Aspergillus fijiensis CBS 313.89]|uniref:ClpP/crotonase n=1 Tax=Aspergillus fijiensis CBS 313.89 TaxID=1448319 RepID=A0A8G1RWE0_9EURO|nr:ClpP/crotonase [Aspergillus fijiensis CBS 313.89]RAK80233.1 ClpP/crotonase [Aspergillus fijiensis CBS 313.89]